MTDRKDEISTLNTLITTLIDSITGYEDAATNIEAGRLRESCFASAPTSVSRSSRSFARKCVASAASPKRIGSFLGKTHQRFVDFKAAITGRDEKAIINEVERGEDYLKEKWRDRAAAAAILAANPRSVVERCYQSVQVRPRPDEPAEARHGSRDRTT